MSRYQTRVLMNGRTVTSGLDTNYRNDMPTRSMLACMPCRAYVIETYATDASERTRNNSNTTRTYEVECDVIMAKSYVFHRRVPVIQKSHGVNDADLWIPRPTTKVVGGGILNLTRVSKRQALQEMPPNLEELDGDQVIVQFLEGDLEMPVITGALSHVKTKRLVLEGNGWAESDLGASRGTPYQKEKYMRYRGTEVRINDDGDVLIDTIGATKDEVTETPEPTGGQVRVRVKSSERFTVQMGNTDVLEVYQDPVTMEVSIDLGEGAKEPGVLGDTLIDLFANHNHATGVGPSGPALVGEGGTISLWQSMKSAIVKLL